MTSQPHTPLCGFPELCPVSLSLAQGKSDLGHLPCGCHSAGCSQNASISSLPAVLTYQVQSKGHTQNCFQLTKAL